MCFSVCSSARSGSLSVAVPGRLVVALVSVAPIRVRSRWPLGGRSGPLAVCWSPGESVLARLAGLPVVARWLFGAFWYSYGSLLVPFGGLKEKFDGQMVFVWCFLRLTRFLKAVTMMRAKNRRFEG